jgi:hypothetical protein
MNEAQQNTMIRPSPGKDLTKHDHTSMPRSRNLLAANLLTAALIVESGISDPIFATFWKFFDDGADVPRKLVAVCSQQFRLRLENLRRVTGVNWNARLIRLGHFSLGRTGRT